MNEKDLIKKAFARIKPSDGLVEKTLKMKGNEHDVFVDLNYAGSAESVSRKNSGKRIMPVIAAVMCLCAAAAAIAIPSYVRIKSRVHESGTLNSVNGANAVSSAASSKNVIPFDPDFDVPSDEHSDQTLTYIAHFLRKDVNPDADDIRIKWISSKAELDEYCEKYRYLYTYDYGNGGKWKLDDVLSRYNSKFFLDGSLLMIYIKAPSPDITVDIWDVVPEPSAMNRVQYILNVKLEKKLPETYTKEPTEWNIVLSLSGQTKYDAANCDVKFTFIEDDRVYKDDASVPQDWHNINSREETKQLYEEVKSADAADKDDTGAAVEALMNKAVMAYEAFFFPNEFFDLDCKAPFSERSFRIDSEIFASAAELHEFAYDIYEKGAVDDYLSDSAEKRNYDYTDEGGSMYVNIRKFPLPTADPFSVRSYVEIKEVSDNRCSFIWHRPALEYTWTQDGDYQYRYIDKELTAEYIGGKWKLTRFLFND